jgi:hypothetical protein
MAPQEGTMSDFETWTSAKPVKSTKVLSAEERKLLPTAKRWSFAALRGITFCILAPFRLFIVVFTHMNSRSAIDAGNEIQREYDDKAEERRRFNAYYDHTSPTYIGPRHRGYSEKPGDQFK